MTRTQQLRMTKVKKEFAAWRKSRAHARARIPEDLWTSAVSLCKEESVGAVSEALGVSRSKLYAKAGAGKLGMGRRKNLSREFATVSLGATLQSDQAQVSLEWTRVGDGARLRMTLAQTEAMNLVNTFLGGGQ